MLATYEGQAKEGLARFFCRIAVAALDVKRDAGAAGVFVEFSFGASLPKSLSWAELLRTTENICFDQLTIIEIAVAVVNQRRAYPAIELEQRRIIPFCGIFRRPAPRLRAHAAHQTAAEQTRDVDLMRRLPVANAAAKFCIDFHRLARPQEPG